MQPATAAHAQSVNGCGHGQHGLGKVGGWAGGWVDGWMGVGNWALGSAMGGCWDRK